MNKYVLNFKNLVTCISKVEILPMTFNNLVTLTYKGRVRTYKWRLKQTLLQKESVMEDCKKEIEIFFWDQYLKVNHQSETRTFLMSSQIENSYGRFFPQWLQRQGYYMHKDGKMLKYSPKEKCTLKNGRICRNGKSDLFDWGLNNKYVYKRLKILY